MQSQGKKMRRKKGEKKKREEKKERRRDVKDRKRGSTLNRLALESPLALVTTLLTLCTLLYCIFKTRATCIRIPRVHTILQENIYTLSCVPTHETRRWRLWIRARETAPGQKKKKNSLWKEPYLRSSYMCTRGRSCSLFYLLFVRTHRYRSRLFARRSCERNSERALFSEEGKNPTRGLHVNIFPTWIFFGTFADTDWSYREKSTR